MKELDKNTLPLHLAMIMDGNGRWAKKRFLPKNEGHKRGAKILTEIAEYCNDIGIKFLTVYAFSTENWSRPKDEVEYLMKLPIEYFNENKDHYKNKNIRIKFIGTKDKLSNEIIDLINKVEHETENNTGLTLVIAFNYGARLEIVEAVRHIIKDQVVSQSVNEKLINEYLYTKDIPDVDLMIRTSGEMRLSNFLLWQNSYSEFYFTKTLWPDFKPSELNKILYQYSQRDRRFGGRNA